MSTKEYVFKAEIKQLLDILIHSLYKERDIFLRELISNASDALTRMQFEMLTNNDIVDPDAELAIWIETKQPSTTDGEKEEGDEGGEAETEKEPAEQIDDHWLIIRDTGIGMTAEEMQQNLGTIAQSGAREFIKTLKEQENQADVNDMIGQFGVGFYSVFMVADEVKVISRSYRPDAEAACWVSSGGDSYDILPADKSDRGTEIHIKLREEAKEFADAWKVRQTVKKHSDFVAYPIYIGDDQINQKESLWRKRPAEVDEEAYNSFYQQMTLDFEPPLATIHFSSDAPVNIRALLFVPAKRESSMFQRRTEPGVMLYSRNVLIQEYCTDLLPKWLQFVDGVVDSEDLSLNVSRETVQNTRLMRQLGKTVRKRVVREISKLLKDDDKLGQFWQEFGRYLKEGLAVAPEDREEIMPLLRFYSSRSNGELISLDTYLERMGEDQKEIYYVLGDDLQSVANSPHLDPFKTREIEVLYLVDPFDAFMAPSLGEYKEKPFRSIDDGQLELPEQDEDSPESEDEAKNERVSESELEKLIERVQTVLGEKITEARPSKILKESPIRLVSPENSQMNSAMSRVYRYVGQDYEIPQKIIELNPRHPLIANLSQQLENNPDAPIIDLTIEQLYESSLVQEGIHPNPAEMLPRIQQLMEMATQKMKS